MIKQIHLFGVALMGLLLGWGMPYAAWSQETGSVQGSVSIRQKDGSIKADLSNVVVYIDAAGLEGAVPPERHPVIRQRGKKYLPEVLPVLAGTTVDFLNDDGIFHNVFSPSPVKSFDLGVYEKASHKSVLFDKPGAVNLYCNIHPDMVGYVVALKNPYFALTGPDGKFDIPGVPAGRHTLKAWQRFGPEASHPVEVGTDMEPVRIELNEEKISIEHKNKWGQDYVEPDDDAY